jgi:hypothetical protein
MQSLPRRGAGVRDLGLALPPERMPLSRRGRPLKRWRYVGVYGRDLMLCVCDVRIGLARQRWWALAEPGRPIRGRTTMGRGGVRIEGSRATIRAPGVEIELEVDEDGGVESVHPSGSSGYVWTRKQAGLPARGAVVLDGRRVELQGEAVVDETAGYHRRRTTWSWSAGVGRGAGGERIGWNLVQGVNDAAKDSERAIWIDGEGVEPGPVQFADDLSRISFADGGELQFDAWSAREAQTNLLLVRSSYRQPFGTFSGELPGGLRLAEGYGVMEWHDARW